jgi:hypothetical protein
MCSSKNSHLSVAPTCAGLQKMVSGRALLSPRITRQQTCRWRRAMITVKDSLSVRSDQSIEKKHADVIEMYDVLNLGIAVDQPVTIEIRNGQPHG